jgi:hypothetical protein
MRGLPVTFRTLDAGGDKTPKYMMTAREENPALGVRGLRASLANPSSFKRQLRAMLAASAFGPVKIMFPMVTGAEDFRLGKSVVEEAMAELEKEGRAFDKKIKIGAMIENPAAALSADILAREADFFRLEQKTYTVFACDRPQQRISARLLQTASHIGSAPNKNDGGSRSKRGNRVFRVRRNGFRAYLRSALRRVRRRGTWNERPQRALRQTHDALYNAQPGERPAGESALVRGRRRDRRAYKGRNREKYPELCYNILILRDNRAR